MSKTNSLKTEYKKISWASKEDLIKKSTAVIAVSVVMGAFITLADFAFQSGINFIIGLF